MYYQTLIQYVLQNTNPICITKHQSSMYYQTLIQYVLQNTNPVCITKH
jgi:PHD/YefM family antitoxin component YafN of YafNO toxin-antitoxin module